MLNKENKRLLTEGELAKARNYKDCVFTVEDWGECGLCSNFNQCQGISKAQDAKTRRETLKEVGNYFWKNLDTDFSFSKFATKLKNGEMPK